MTFLAQANCVLTEHPDGSRRLFKVVADPIVKVVADAWYVCVITEPPIGVSAVANLHVFAYDGSDLWSAHASSNAGNDNIFVDAKFSPNDPDRLLVWDWEGFRHEFSLSSGRAISVSFLK